MTALQVHRQLARLGTATVALNNIVALQQAAALAAQHLPVRWSFEPSTPATVVDYLAGGVHGAAEGAAAGLGVGILLALIFPLAIVPYATAGGATLGAARGINRVEQGWRVRVTFAIDGQPLLEVRRVA